MMIGRTDAWQNPLIPAAKKAVLLFGCHARNPSGPAVIDPHLKAGHMTARETNQKIPQRLLDPNGPSTHGITLAASSASVLSSS